MRASRDHEGSRRDHIRLEPSTVPFLTVADVAQAGERGDLVVRICQPQPGLVGNLIRRQTAPSLVRDHAHVLNRAHRDHVLGRARCIDAARATIASREHRHERLRTGHARQRIAHRRIPARRRQRVGARAVIAPAVVRNERLRSRSGLLQVTVGYIRTKCPIERQRKNLRLRSHAPEVRIRHRTGNPLRRNRRTVHATARDRAGNVGAVAVQIIHGQRRIRRHPPDEIGMNLIHPGVIHIHLHPGAAQFTATDDIIPGKDGICRYMHPRAGKIIRDVARQEFFDHLDATQTRQRHERIFRRTHHQLPTERRAFFS